MELLILSALFWMLYLHTRVGALQKELSALKKSHHVAQEVTPMAAKIALSDATPVTKAVHEYQEELRPSAPKEAPKEASQTYKAPVQRPPSKLLSAVQNYFTQGNIVVRVGGVVLLFGLAFLVKYAAEHALISIEMRLAGVALGALVLLLIGWRLRHREGYYGLVLQGIGVAILYLVVFGAAKIYGLIALGAAFALMLLFVVLGAVLAVVQNASILALFAIVGGFMVPILTSDGSGSHQILFGYYVLLNTGIAAIAWYRSWRMLNLAGFAFTFFIAMTWGVLRYNEEWFATTEPFLVLYFLQYLLISILFTIKDTFNPRAMVDATLVFGVPLAAFTSQVALVRPFEYGAAWSAVAMGVLYVALYKVLKRRDKTQLLAQAFGVLGVLFLTVAVPFAFEARTSAAFWVLEGAAVLWIALRQDQRYARMFAQILQWTAALWYVDSMAGFEAERAFLNSGFLGFVLIVGAGMWSAYLLYMYREKLVSFERDSEKVFVFGALGLWMIAGWIETVVRVQSGSNELLIYVALSALVFASVAGRLAWNTLAVMLEYYWLAGIAALLILVPQYLHTHPFAGIGSVALALYFGVHYRLLYQFDAQWKVQRKEHIGAFLAMVLLLSCEAVYAMSLMADEAVWKSVAWIIPSLIVLWVMLREGPFLPARFAAYREDYRIYGLGTVSAALVLWELHALRLDAIVAAPAYVPLLNPLELLQIAGVWLAYRWLREVNGAFALLRPARFAALMVPIFATMMLARTVHAYAGVDYDLGALMHSALFQSSLSVLWGLMAFGAVIVAKYRNWRELWIGGAALMGVVVVKLFVVELSNSGSIERIVSFLAVGLLMLIVGYFAPLPPSSRQEEKMV